jgi:hypothetical protein
MSENKDIDTTPVVEVKEEPKAEVKSAPAPVADSTDYWANAWANRGV